jgi:hypothetical protein|tara:strand:+ start:415 stop:792 length:378 start_codon:yes stop_codon:yes gene_type:complete
MKIPKYLQTNNVVNIGHNSNRSISQEAYKQLKDTITRVLNSLDVADKKHRASHGDDYFFADELTNPKDVERYPGSPVEYGKYRRANPYEKQSFARDTESLIGGARSELIIAKIKLDEAINGGDDE